MTEVKEDAGPGSAREEIRDLTIEFRTFRGVVSFAAALAVIVLAFLGWNTRQSIENQVAEAVRPQVDYVDSLVSSVDTVRLADLTQRIEIAENRYAGIIGELDSLAASSEKLQDRLFEGLSTNPPASDSTVSEWIQERNHDVFELLRPKSGLIPGAGPIYAIVRLTPHPNEVDFLKMLVSKPGEDGVSCLNDYTALEGINKLRCDKPERGQYDLHVVAFLKSDRNRDPRPGYTSTVAIRVQ